MQQPRPPPDIPPPLRATVATRARLRHVRQFVGTTTPGHEYRRRVGVRHRGWTVERRAAGFAWLRAFPWRARDARSRRDAGAAGQLRGMGERARMFPLGSLSLASERHPFG